MGGSDWDRDVYGGGGSSGSDGAAAFSARSNERFNRTDMHADLNPHNRAIATDAASPIVCCIDVTGSMGNWSKVIWDKLPMFFGQIMQQGYLEEPAICFAGVGDANSDEAPLQVCDFASGPQLDDEIPKMWLEGNGGGQGYETYELAGYYFLEHAHYSGLAPGTKPFLFFTGDEGYYPLVLKKHIKQFIGFNEKPNTVASADMWERLRDKYHVFLLHKPYHDAESDARMRRLWEDAIGGEHVLPLHNPRAVVDVMLGAIALVSGTRTLDRYERDMRNRGQDADRLEEVNAALRALSMSTSAAVEAVASTSDPADVETALARARAAYAEFMLQAGEAIPDDGETRRLRDEVAALQADKGVAFPEDLVGPITQEPLVDPVVCDDGHTYERASIEQWLETHNTSPLTNEPLESKDLIPNIAIRNAIAEWVSKYA